MPRHSSHALLVLPASVVSLLLASHSANAVDAIEFEAREISIAGVPFENAKARLDIFSDKQTRVTLTAQSAKLAAPAGRISNITLRCDSPVIAEPRYGCDAGTLTAHGGPTGSIGMRVTAAFDADRGVTTFTGKGQEFAGTQADIEGRIDSRGWQVSARTGEASVAALRKIAAPWVELPKDLTLDGKAVLVLVAADSGTGPEIDLDTTLSGIDLSNEASTLVAEKLGAKVSLHAIPRERDTGLTVKVAGTQGQTLLGPILLDLVKNPLAMELEGTLVDTRLDITKLAYSQRDAVELTGLGVLELAPEFPEFTGRIQLVKLQFPAAYTSYMQITLATSMLGELATDGSLSGVIDLERSAPSRVHLTLAKVGMHDAKDRVHLTNAVGDVHWSPAGGEALPSRLAWDAGGAFGLSGTEAEMHFVVDGTNFALTQPTRVPIFDGVLAIERFAMQNIGADAMELAFKGEVLPISMVLLCRVFGWPEFQGTIAGKIPGVTLKNNVLTFDGNVEAQVFGGSIVGSNLRLQDPLGRFPEMFADVRARSLDLSLVTNTFEVGSITGGLEADILGLHLFAWSPIEFDARLATPKGDRSRHRISAKAVSSLSNVGGGGGGVVAALQSGVLRFFDEYSYDKLGIRCRLKNDVCLMSGVEPAKMGYYIVKGAGIPRIDIIGSAGRVNWPQLLSGIESVASGSGPEVR
jgi:hypothetical protein